MSIVKFNDKEFHITGKLVRVMSLRDELMDIISDPDAIKTMSIEERIPADIFTFTQQLPDLTPKYTFHMEWDNIAALPINTFEEWFKNQVHRNTRNKIKKASKKGINVKVEKIDRTLASGLVDIFNETPIRRGRVYPYFGKNIDEVIEDWSPDLERSDFVVAYFENEMVGFIKVVYCDQYARTSGTVAKISHRDKSPMNALLARVVELCASKKIPFLIYGKFVY